MSASESTPAELARAAALLELAPGDLDAWLEVAARLASIGAEQESNEAFDQLGRSACDTGRVALAVACARWLATRDADRAKKLTDRILQLHAAGSKRLDDAAVPPPLARQASAPGLTLPETAEGATKEAAIASAVKAVAAAAASAAAQAEKKVAPTPLVSSLPKQTLRAFIEAMTVHAFPEGQVVIDVGQPAEALYWLARGRAEVSRQGTVLGELVPGGFFGEIAMVSGSKRSARVTTLSDVWLLEIPTAAVEAAAAKEPKLAEVLATHARTRLLANLMRTSEIFTALAPEDRASLLPRFEPVMIPVGKQLISEGDDNQHLWLVVSGRCEVRNNATVIASLGPGGILGEISLLAQKPATADVVAVEPCTLLRLPRNEFEAIATKYPEVLAEVYKLVVARESANRAIEHDAADLVV